MKRMLCLLTVCLGLTACATVHTPSHEAAAPQLKTNKPVYIAIGKDNFPTENKAVQQMFVTACTPYAKTIFQAKKPLDRTYMKKIADVLKDGYIIYPQITQWEDHNTPWTTIRDKVSLHVTLMDARTQRILFDDTLYGKSNLWTMKNNQPDVVAVQLVDEFVDELFAE